MRIVLPWLIPARLPRAGRAAAALVLAIVALLTLRFLVAADGYPALVMKRNEIRRLSREVKRLEVENGELEASIRSLSSDLYAVEKMAREELDFTAPGEVVYLFPAELPAAPSGSGTDGADKRQPSIPQR